MRSALLLGATGLVGRELLHQLVADAAIGKLVVVGRRSSGVTHAKLEEHIFELDSIEQHRGVFAVDEVYCALGTTIRKAGSQEQFRTVDFDYPLRAARAAHAAGATHYLLVSAIGADAGSRFFYNRVKGELEKELMKVGFAALTIARPSLLLGERAEHRRGEAIAKRLGWLMPPKYKPVEAAAVARALVNAARDGRDGVRIIESRDLR